MHQNTDQPRRHGDEDGAFQGIDTRCRQTEKRIEFLEVGFIGYGFWRHRIDARLKPQHRHQHITHLPTQARIDQAQCRQITQQFEIAPPKLVGLIFDLGSLAHIDGPALQAFEEGFDFFIAEFACISHCQITASQVR